MSYNVKLHLSPIYLPKSIPCYSLPGWPYHKTTGLISASETGLSSLPSQSLYIACFFFFFFLPRDLVAQLVKNLPAVQETWLDSWVGKIPWRKDKLATPVFLGFPGDSDGKESAWNAGDRSLIPGLGRSPGRGCGSPLQSSCLEDPMDRRVWRVAVHGVAKS